MKTCYKFLIIITIPLIALVGCDGGKVALKSDEDRASVTMKELDQVREKISQVKGVKSFKINYDEVGIYGELIVTDKKYAKKAAVEAFTSMMAETSGIVDLFVMEDNKEHSLLIQAFKPAGTDNENKWDILY